MASRLLSEAMPVETNYGLNFFDQTPVNVGSGLAPGYSGGAALVHTVRRPQTINQWTILGWGLAFQGAMFNIQGGAQCPIFARLGKLYGGLVRNSGLQEDSPAPFTGLPRDTSMIELLWDGKVDDPFPQATSQSPFVPGAQSMEQHQATLPAPLILDPGDDLQIGFWLTPMLGQNVRIWFFRAIYTIVYDPST